MLFVDDDEAEIGNGAEDGRASSDDDLHLAAVEFLPSVVPLSMGETMVEDGDLFTEAAPEPLDGLRCKSNFGNEEDGTLFEGESVFNRLEIDFCFAAACDTVDQMCLEPAVVETGLNVLQSLGLFGG